MKIHRQIASKQTPRKEGKTPVKRICQRCGVEIKIGEAYYWIKHRHMGKEYFCHLHVPGPRDMTTSDKLRQLYEAQDQISDAVTALQSIVDDSIHNWQGTDEPEEPEIEEDDDGDSQDLHDDWEEEHKEWEEKKEEYEAACSDLEDGLNELASALNEAAESAREVADGYHESADNQEEYFPGSSQAEEIREKGDEAENWADSLESAASDVEGLVSEVDASDPINGRRLDDIIEEAVRTAEDARDELSL